MEKSYQDFLSHLDQNFLDNLSEEITTSFATHNGYSNGAIPSKDFVSFANYSSRMTTRELLEKYHEWLNL